MTGPRIADLVEPFVRDAGRAGVLVVDRPAPPGVRPGVVVVEVPGSVPTAFDLSGSTDAAREAAVASYADLQHTITFRLAERRGRFAPWPACPLPAHLHELRAGLDVGRPGEPWWLCPSAGPVVRLGDLSHPAAVPPAGGALWPNWIGPRWRARAVRIREAKTVLPDGLRAGVEFRPDGRFSMADPVNTAFGRYDVTSTGVRTGTTGTTLAAYAGSDPAYLAVIDTVRGIVGAGDVRVHVDGDRLMLAAGPYRMIACRE